MSNGKIDIPVTWIYEQIKEHPGIHAASWNYLLDLWDAHLTEARYSQQPVKNDEYVRLHKDPGAAHKFWKEGTEWEIKK